MLNGNERPDRVARRRPHPDAHRQRQHDRRRLGLGRLRVLRGGLGDRARSAPRAGRSSRSTSSRPTRRPARNGRWCCPAPRGILFRTRRANQAMGDFQIVAMTLPHGEPHVLMRGVYARYSPTGHLLVVTADGKLVGVPFDLDKLALTGPPVGLLEGIGIEVGGFSTNLALSSTGTLVYTTGAADADPAAGVGHPRGAGEPGGLHLAAAGHHRLVRALARRPRPGRGDAVQNGNGAIWVKQIPAGPFSRLTFGDTVEPAPHLVRRRTLAGLHRQRDHQRRHAHEPARRRHREPRRRCCARPSPSARRSRPTTASGWCCAARSSKPGRATSTRSARATRRWCRW